VSLSLQVHDSHWPRVSYSGGIYLRREFDIGGYPPHQLEFFGNFYSGFENLITSGILRHLEAELSILRCLKLIRGVVSTFKKKKAPPLIFFWRKSCTVLSL
jgi:hypothetical protein